MNQTTNINAESVDSKSDRKAARKARVILKKTLSLVVFSLLALYFASISPTITIAWVVVILTLTIYLFVFEVVDIDVAAISIMVLLGLSSLLAPVMGLDHGLVDTKHLFDGFSSNAVMSIIAVMIIGAGLDKTGLMSKVSSFILNIGGTSEKRIIPIISGTVAIISSFMQNVGAAALFLPVVSRISSRANLPMSRLLMPMGFCAILGGTVTMVGSSPLTCRKARKWNCGHYFPRLLLDLLWCLPGFYILSFSDATYYRQPRQMKVTPVVKTL
jgi:Na+/H+ antiporter NhaD/arsenite permease-like protein